ncbi:homoserine/homoserine lactone efflux protein [Acidihalobacter ferrooxydans]|uniref:Homoserine/homoserine lactone efflux protein n=1 Tax=Acidihalobacter ferrooxydans TaxID=1765967 RepID=A0A1P8UJK1_9GAMM|nr:homoserine/homoserine lactone efflux protein [Acidihalobacter ferrooxydans]APZ44009.1 homoserine/homoserine lactone efflux protein [Acidihalobacter ferrooxydans]
MELHLWLALVAAALLISLSPGAGAITSMSYGLSHGMRNAVFAVLGLQVGLVGQLLIVGVGLGSLIAASETLFEVIKWVGVLYLIWLGIGHWRAAGELRLKAAGAQFRPAQAFARAVLVNLTNPKATVFLVALLPQFIDPTRPEQMQLLVIGLTLVAVDTVVMSGYSGLASRLRRLVARPRAVLRLNRITGSALIGVALLLSLAHGRAPGSGH